MALFEIWMDIALALLSIGVVVVVINKKKSPRITSVVLSLLKGIYGLLLALPLFGLASGLLSSYLIPYETGIFYAGIIFGFSLALCLLLFHRLPSRWAILHLTFASTIAYFPSIFFMARPDAPIPSFVSGFVGAALLFCMGVWPLFLTSVKIGKVVLMGICWAVAGGFLVILSWMSDPAFGDFVCEVLHQGDCSSRQGIVKLDNSYYSLYPIWQAGMASALGIILWIYPRAARSNEDSPTVNT